MAYKDPIQTPEPFAWMSNRYKHRPGPYKIDLSTPRSEAIFGIFLIACAAFFVWLTLQDGSPEALALGIGSGLVFGGLGSFLIVMAIIRHRWFKAYYSDRH